MPRRNNAVRHLTVISRDLLARMTTALVEERGYESLRPSLGPLLSLVWQEARPITLLAQQLGITKQACSQLASLAEWAGYLERRPDPDDGRVKLVSLSPRGRTLVARSIEIIRKADEDYAEIVGRESYARFTSTIAALYKALDVPAKTDLAFLERATRTVGALPLITERAQQELMRTTAARGHAGLKLSHSQILPFVGSAGVRVSDLARIHGTGPQAINASARDLVALGYLRREFDPRDRRGALLFLTDRGARLVADSIAELRVLQRRIEDVLGREVLRAFLSTAEQLHAALAVGDDIFDLSAAASRATGDEREIAQLAARLHRELGARRSMRLAELLKSHAAAAAH